ncbi:hypothetical protein ACFLXL_00245 [Chloroflexota bacterium]
MSREHANNSYNEASLIASSVPIVPANDRGNRDWRGVRLWAKTYSSEIMKVYDLVKSKTVTMKILGLRSLGPLHTACLREGRLELIPESYRARSRAKALAMEVGDTGLKQQMAGLALELRRTRKAMDKLWRKLDQTTKQRSPLRD